MDPVLFILWTALTICSIFWMGYAFGYQAAMKWNLEYDRKKRQQ